MSLLSVHGVGKAFRQYRTEWHRFASWFGVPVLPVEENWVLKNISFDIQPGEAIGLIGQNGAGKSTLLKIITGTMRPTEGRVRVNGRVTAILELGMGFNPELSARKNVMHSAGIMGIGYDQIQELMSDIENFAEVGDYFDEPMRTFSSGMQMRVAFAVATAVRPDLLIVDEALSVGDAYFQHKSFARIREFQKQGTTLLIVSHDRTAIQSLCNRAILLGEGRVLKEGNPEEIFDFYNALIAEKEDSTVEVIQLANGKVQTTSGTGEAKIESVSLHNDLGKLVDHVAVGDRVTLKVQVKVNEAIESLVLGYGIKDRLGQVMYGTNTWHTGQVVRSPDVGNVYQFTIAFQIMLGVGSYSVQVALVDQDTHLSANYEWRDMALMFNVVNPNRNHFAGCLWNEPEIKVSQVDSRDKEETLNQ